MTLLDMTIAYKISSFLYLHSNFWYNSLGSTCTCHYSLVGTNMSQRASSSKLNFRFIDSSTVHHWECHNSAIWSAIEVNEHLMESLFDSFQIDLGPSQYHVGKASKSPIDFVTISGESYTIIMGLLDILGT